jgi:hypothetical protein
MEKKELLEVMDEIASDKKFNEAIDSIGELTDKYEEHKDLALNYVLGRLLTYFDDPDHVISGLEMLKMGYLMTTLQELGPFLQVILGEYDG